MARVNTLFASLNMGEVSQLALARTDLQRLRVAAQSMVNWLPRTLGPMMLRPGTEFIGEVKGDAPAKIFPFVSAFDDTAILELTDSKLRVWVNDALVTRKAVGTTIPPFSSWTFVATGTSQHAISGGAIIFNNVNAGASATATTAVTVAAADQATEHAARVVIVNGPVIIRIGSASGLDDIFGQETLDTGTYSLAFTPNVGTFYVQFATTASPENYNTLTQTQPQALQNVIINSISIENAGVMELPTPWALASIQAPSKIRVTQSADIVYVAAPGVAQYQINRYSPTSWSVVSYRSVKGPMAATARDPSVSLTPAGLSGNITITSNKPFFKQSDVGTLFRLFTNGQNVNQSLSFNSTYTDTIRVAGVSYVSGIDSGGNIVNTAVPDRTFNFQIAGTWTGTLNLSRSFEGPTSGFTVFQSYSSNTSASITDDLQNEIIWYRFGFDPGDYGSGTAVISLDYPGGGGAGVVHITGFNSSTSVSAEVLVPLYNLGAYTDWRQSEWSSSQGYPTSVALYGGRLWWAGADKWWGSISDDYTNFDYDATGDAAPIDESIGQGPIANINWLLALDHLLAGADTSIITALSDAIDTPLTPTNFNLRQSVTNGSFAIQAGRIDQMAVYVDQSGRRLYELIYDIRIYNYRSTDLTNLNPDIGIPGFVDLVVQRQPDTRVHLPRTDGVIASLIHDVDDDVRAFWKIQTQGSFESLAVLPGVLEDQVYAIVNRTIGGVTKRYLEKFARIDECQGGSINKNVDCHLTYNGAATNLLSGFGHIIGQTVCIWGNGVDLGTAVVDASGDVAIPGGVQVTQAAIGLGYSAEWISTKLAYGAQMGTAINQVKRIDHVGLVMSNTHYQGVRYGMYRPNDPGNTPNGVFTTPQDPLDDLPLVEYGLTTPANTIWKQYDAKMFEFPSDGDTDVRIYLQAASPRPATVLGLTFSVETSN